MQHELSALTESWGLALGLLFMVVVIAAPTGLMGWLRAAVGARGR